MKNLWRDLPKPLFVQAPMEDVTDTVFRQMLARNGKPDIFFTEFTNVDGVFSEGGKRVIHRLKFNPDVERPIIAQIWGHNPENYFEGAKYVKELGFDGVDINMGCPQRNVMSKGLCAALIDNEEHAAKIIQATIDGADGLPVSVKTRIGVKEIDTERWIRFLLGFDIQTITVHGRTAKEKSKVPCHWDEIAKAVQIRDEVGSDILIIGNGDVHSMKQAREYVEKYGVDGVMIARGLMDDIYFFNEDRHTMSQQEALETLLQHIDLFEKAWKNTDEFTKSTHVIKKYVKVYIRDFDGAKEIRTKIMECQSLADMRKIIDSFSS